MKDSKTFMISRRKFLGTTATAAAAFTILPSRTIAGLGHTPPSDKLNIAGIGVGGVGLTNLRYMESENIVALCDVDWEYASPAFKKFPNAAKYMDFRTMLEKQKNIDAVVIATPDHTHAVAAMKAIQMNKHIFLQMPLTHSVYEARILTETARQYSVVTQMGNQGSSGEGVNQICEWIWAGAIGEVTEVHAWTNRPLWPQGLERPRNSKSAPKSLNWDLFIGPASYREYNPIYTPWNWRAWWDFGNGALGDMGCHILDPVFKALKLKNPVAVEASSTPMTIESLPSAQKITWWFPSRDNLPKVAMPEVKVHWYDGGLLPERPQELAPGIDLGQDPNGGLIIVGAKGKIMCGVSGANPTLLPVEEMSHFNQPEKSLRRIQD
ncbi:MAG: Gfo/Idh/MocA family oxidoreductase, partial [Bacteroidota bacterium]|nr:Gfo/Idh/MocA family oxidoreductase [Bacteroidota bacterium]